MSGAIRTASRPAGGPLTRSSFDRISARDRRRAWGLTDRLRTVQSDRRPEPDPLHRTRSPETARCCGHGSDLKHCALDQQFERARQGASSAAPSRRITMATLCSPRPCSIRSANRNRRYTAVSGGGAVTRNRPPARGPANGGLSTAALDTPAMISARRAASVALRAESSAPFGHGPAACRRRGRGARPRTLGSAINAAAAGNAGSCGSRRPNRQRRVGVRRHCREQVGVGTRTHDLGGGIGNKSVRYLKMPWNVPPFVGHVEVKIKLTFLLLQRKAAKSAGGHAQGPSKPGRPPGNSEANPHELEIRDVDLQQRRAGSRRAQGAEALDQERQREFLAVEGLSHRRARLDLTSSRNGMPGRIWLRIAAATPRSRR